MIFSIIITVVALGFMVIVHELGHMLTAKSFGVIVHEFSIGMGPKLFSVKKGETAYSLRLLPIGGFVQLEGEPGAVDPGADKTISVSEEDDNPRSFVNQAWWKRLIILVAGAAVNILVGWLLFVIINSNLTIVPTVINYIPQEYESQSVFRAGDEILRVDGARVHTRSDVNMSVALAREDILDVVVRRNGEVITLRAPLQSRGSQRLLGVVFSELNDPNAFTIMRYSAYDTVYVVKAVVWAVRDLILGRQSVDSLSGPVEIVSVVDTVAQSGADDTWLALLSLFALISVNLGVFNLLPIPGLDGGQMLFVVIERIIRRKIKPEVIGTINFVCFALLMVLAVYVTFGDVMGLIQG